MDTATVALFGVMVSGAVGVAGLVQNTAARKEAQKLKEQTTEIKFHVDGRLDAALAELAAVKAELLLSKVLVASQVVDRGSTPASVEVIAATADAATALAATEEQAADVETASRAHVAEHAAEVTALEEADDSTEEHP